jgi:hypothetical protein
MVSDLFRGGTMMGQNSRFLNQKKKGTTNKLVNPLFSLRSHGAEGQNRTADTGIFSRIFRKSELPVFLSS